MRSLPESEEAPAMTPATDLDPERSLGALVAELPARAQLFEQLRFDYCCGGRQSLAEACAKRGLDVAAVRAALQALDVAERSDDVERRDWRAVGLGELCGRIVAVHHDGLREAFPRIGSLLEAAVRVHGASDPRLHDVQRVFAEVRADLELHLASEEGELFPACIAWEQRGTLVDERMISEHEREHAALGDVLSALRVLCDDYDRTSALCNTHQALLAALEAFEQDLHRHVHEENNILLLRVREPHAREAAAVRRAATPERAAARSIAAPSEALLPCCEGWIAEQTHSWARHRR